MANTFTWITTAGGTWNTSGTGWSQNGSTPSSAPGGPGSGNTDVVQFRSVARGSYTVTFDETSPWYVGALNVNGSNATLAFTNGNQALTVSGATTIAGSSPATEIMVDAQNVTLSLNGGLVVSTGDGGTLNDVAGTVAVSGLTTIEAAGVISIGSDPALGGTGTLTTGSLAESGGTFTQTAGSVAVTGLADFAGGAATFSGGALTAGTLAVGGTSNTLTLSGGTLTTTVNSGTANTIASGDTIAIGAGAVLDFTNAGTNAAAGVVNSGVIRGAGTVDGEISGAGTVTASSGTLDLTSNVPAASLILNVDTTAGSVLQFGGAVGSASTVQFSGHSGGIELSDFTTSGRDSLNFSGTIAAMNVGTSASVATNEIIVSGPNASQVTASFSGMGASGTLTISDTNGVISTISLSGLTGSTSGLEFANWSAASSNTTDIWLSNAVCFAAGTRIATAKGDIPVEMLREGDLVLTHDGEHHPIKWLGYRRLDLSRHAQPALAAPVRICRHAFGVELPRRDLVVSPDHCIFVDGKLIPAKLLLNDMTIVQQRTVREVEYYHVELDRHDVLLAEGLPAESYLDTGNRAFFSNAGLALVLHPEFHINAGLKCWETDACAPLAVSQAVVKPIWQHLAHRAEVLGYQRPSQITTEEPQLRLVADGRVIRPLSGTDNRYVFVLPAGVTSVQLTSRTAVPSYFEAYLDDWRALGVAVRRIVVRDQGEVYEIPPDHPGLTRGWFRVERDAATMWRWTNGDAVVPIEPAVGPAIVEVHVAMTMRYVADRAQAIPAPLAA